MKEVSWSEVKDFLIFTKRIIFLFKNYEAIVHKLDPDGGPISKISYWRLL